ncbi:MAG: hypothetical protein RLZ37_155, partial [Actinomycetota bacterium]
QGVCGHKNLLSGVGVNGGVLDDARSPASQRQWGESARTKTFGHTCDLVFQTP